MEKQIYIPCEGFSTAKYKRFIFTGDVGGSNTHLAIVGARDWKHFDVIFKCTYETFNLPPMWDLVNDLLKEAKERYGIEVGGACFGAAGPVTMNRSCVQLTNADVTLNKEELLTKTMLNQVILLNDFEAIGYGIDMLNHETDVDCIPPVGEDAALKVPYTRFAVLGAGAGLGMTIAPYDDRTHLHKPLPCEGGHMEFAPHDHLELGLVDHLKREVLSNKEAQPECERVLSVKGIEHIYNYLTSLDEFKNGSAYDKLHSQQGIEKVRAIEAEYENDHACRKTIDLFLNIYARVARNLALISECYSGLYLVGKVTLKHLDKIKQSPFMEEFERHDKRLGILKKVPVYVVKNPDVGLYGCANVAYNFFNVYP